MKSDANKVANIVGGRTARACDSCIRKRARWYCAADDAFLCQSCDSTVHSANPLARRHERVRLSTASYKNHADKSRETDSTSVPSWHSRKARTRRGKKSSRSKNPTSDEVVRNPFYLVPEIRSDESTSFDDCDRQLQLYGRVPILDSLEAVDAGTENNVTPSGEHRSVEFDENEMKGFVGNFCDDLGFLASDMELEEFAADVETLLGKGSGDEPFEIDGLGLMQFSMEVEGSADRSGSGRGRAKDEIEIASDPFESSFDYDKAVAGKRGDDSDEKAVKKMKILLRLDYESIMSAWDRSSPWTSSTRPEVDPNECWPTSTGTCGIEFHEQPLATGLGRRMGQSGDGEREARVSRYREKRRSRLFSKKIRYEVRKLNAEKRPRMKGRFVKRLSSSSSCPTGSGVALFT